MALYQAVCTRTDHHPGQWGTGPGGIWVAPPDGGVDRDMADHYVAMHGVDYGTDHYPTVEAYVPPAQPQPPPGPQPGQADACAPEKVARDGAAAALATVWLAMGPACAPSPTAVFTCPLAIGAVVGAYLQLKGNQAQYERCLSDHGLHAEADAQGGAIAALDDEINQLQALSDQMEAASAGA